MRCESTIKSTGQAVSGWISNTCTSPSTCKIGDNTWPDPPQRNWSVGALLIALSSVTAASLMAPLHWQSRSSQGKSRKPPLQSTKVAPCALRKIRMIPQTWNWMKLERHLIEDYPQNARAKNRPELSMQTSQHTHTISVWYRETTLYAHLTNRVGPDYLHTLCWWFLAGFALALMV